MKRTLEQQLIPTLVRRHDKGRLDLNPDFQRPPVWAKSQQRLLVDTVLRDMDIPKIYLREVSRGEFTHEVIDGQQRLRAVIDFCKGGFKTEPAAIDGKQIRAAFYDDLDEDLRAQFDTYQLSVVVLRDADDDEVKDMFLRLQNGTPLHASETRNAMTGNMRDFIGDGQVGLWKHGFFQNCGFNNRRYQFHQVAAQMVRLGLGLARAGNISNIKKSDLDKMYKSEREFDKNSQEAREIKSALGSMLKAFPDAAPEIKPHNAVSLFLLFSHLRKNFAISGREEEIGKWFVAFEKKRLADADNPIDERENELVEYQEKTRHSTDSAESLEYRQKVLRARLFGEIPDLKPLAQQRSFTDGQRLAIWRRDGGVCQLRMRCEGVRCEWDGAWHADHKIPHIKGGETTVENGQVACAACNLAKGGSTQKTHKWTGARGDYPPYRVYPIGFGPLQLPDLSEFAGRPGNYILAKQMGAGEWQAVHIGETNDLSKQPDKFVECVRAGATHIHVRENSCGSAVREGEVEDLKEKWNPPRHF